MIEFARFAGVIRRPLGQTSRSAWFSFPLSFQYFIPFSLNPLNPLSFNPQSLKGRGLPLPLSLPGSPIIIVRTTRGHLLLQKCDSRCFQKKHLKSNTSKIIKKWSNGLNNNSQSHQQLSPWEVRKEPGTKIVIKSADLNYNNYLQHFSHVCNVEKPQFSMKTGTKNRQKSMPGACLRKTPQNMSLFNETCSKWTPAGTLKSSKIDPKCLEVLPGPTF